MWAHTAKRAEMPKLLPVLLLAAFIGLAHAKAPALPVEDFTQDTAYKVRIVIDGDTVVIGYKGTPTKVRMIGVDTPETVHPQKPVEEYGREASAFTKNLLLGESVYLRFDQEKKDKYGRLLAYLYRAPDGLFVNLEIVRQGYGHAYTLFPFKHLETFRYYELRARDAEKGLWNKRPVSQKPTGRTSQKVEPKAETQPTNLDTVYATRSGRKYHRSGCRYLSKSQVPYTLEEAKARYSPCRVCKPPE